jgi:hypothetical protein
MSSIHSLFLPASAGYPQSRAAGSSAATFSSQAVDLQPSSSESSKEQDAVVEETTEALARVKVTRESAASSEIASVRETSADTALKIQRLDSDSLIRWHPVVCSLCRLPSHWQHVDYSVQHGHLISLSSSGEEYQRIARHFQETTKDRVIQSIYRIQNAALYRQYEQRKQQLQAKKIVFTEHPLVYHGTRDTAPSLIYDSAIGFDPTKARAIYPSRSHSPPSWFAGHAAYSVERFSHNLTTQRASAHGSTSSSYQHAVLVASVVTIDHQSDLL